MGAKPIKHRDDATVQLSVRMPGWLKNKVAEVAKSRNLTMNAWAALVLYRAAESGLGYPDPPPSPIAPPTTADLIEGSLLGEPRAEPCGAVAPCKRWEAGTRRVADAEFCNECGIRVE